MKSMPPPQPSGLPLLERVTVSPSGNVVVLDPPPFVPVTYVAKIPTSNSFPRKNETGGGAGATISFDGGGPAKEIVACDMRASTVKGASLFIGIRLRCQLPGPSPSLTRLSTSRDQVRSYLACEEIISIHYRLTIGPWSNTLKLF